MKLFALHVLGWILMTAALLISGEAFAGTPATPTLFRATSAVPTTASGGVQKSWPIKLSESAAISAVAARGMWLPNPETGARVYAKYKTSIVHSDGTWTWIGTVSTVHGEQSVVLTFGKGVVFGYVPQPTGWPLRIGTEHGQTRITQTNGKELQRSPGWLRRQVRPDYVIPPRASGARSWHTLETTGTGPGTTAQGTTNPLAAASAAAPVTITVMVAYTPGLVSVYGGTSAVLTRIRYLVDWTNQAYVNSDVYIRLQLVDTVEVNYTDGNSDGDALYDITGENASGAAAIPAPLQAVASLRAQYGADLVVLLRPYDAAAESSGECGIGWEGGEAGGPFMPTYGYAVVGDIADGTITDGVNCADWTMAHELGHNMGDAHDRATASSGAGAEPGGGAYPYAYGYKSSSIGICTIMAYCDSGETPIQVFSNPNVFICNNHPCGVADSSPSSADNAHSMNNTAPFVAAFEPPIVAGQPLSADLTGDGVDELLWRQPVSGNFAYWQLNGWNITSTSAAYDANTSFALVASGRFFGASSPDDLVWENGGSIWMWVPTGSGFNSVRVANMPVGWKIIGVGKFDASGDEDLLFRNISTSSGVGRVAYWRMIGATVVYRSPQYQMFPSYHEAAIGDFSGNGQDGILWTNGTSIVMWQSSSATGFTQVSVALSHFVWRMLARCLTSRSCWRDGSSLHTSFGGGTAMGGVHV